MNDGKITYSRQDMDTAEGQAGESGQMSQGGQTSQSSQSSQSGPVSQSGQAGAGQQDGQSVQLFTLLNNQIPIQQYEGGQYQVKVFGNFTQLSDEDGAASVLEDSRLLMKRGDFIPVSAEMDYLNGRVDQVLVDSITGGNGSTRYLSVLENNQRIEDYYEQIQWPEELSNAGIQEISSTLDTNDTVLMVRYTDNTVAAFNYVTGSLLFKDETEKETLSFGDYVGNWFTETWSNLWGPDTIEYDKIKVMEQELERKPLDAVLKGTEIGNGENLFSGEKIVYNVNAPGGSNTADSGVSQLMSDTSALENYRKPGESGKNGAPGGQKPAAPGADAGTYSGKFTGTISGEGAGQNPSQGANQGTNSGTGQGTNAMSVEGAAGTAEKTNTGADTETMSGAGHKPGTEKEAGEGSTSGIDSALTVGGLSGTEYAGYVSGDVPAAGNVTGQDDVSGRDNTSDTGNASLTEDGSALYGQVDGEGQNASEGSQEGETLQSGQEDIETGRTERNQSEELEGVSGEAGEDERTDNLSSGQETSQGDGQETSQGDGGETSQKDGQETDQGDGQETSQKDSQETSQAAAGTVTGESGNGTGSGAGNGNSAGNPGMETGDGTGTSGSDGVLGTQAMEKGESSLPKVQLDPYLPVYDPKTGTYQLYDTREYLNQSHTTEPLMSISQKLENVGAGGMGSSKGFFGNQTGVMGYVVTVVGVLLGALVLLRCAVNRVVKH